MRKEGNKATVVAQMPREENTHGEESGHWDTCCWPVRQGLNAIAQAGLKPAVLLPPLPECWATGMCYHNWPDQFFCEITGMETQGLDTWDGNTKARKTTAANVPVCLNTWALIPNYSNKSCTYTNTNKTWPFSDDSEGSFPILCQSPWALWSTVEWFATWPSVFQHQRVIS
jgi:hypothetical protein